MAVHVRDASLSDDKAVLIDLAKTYLTANADERRFQWLYRENPSGPARAWIACDDQNQAVGMAAVFPRRMYCDGGVVPGCVLGDLCVSREYRSLGPALQLQRACLAHARSGDFDLAYDFPSATMVGLYRHLGIQSDAKLIRWVKALRVEMFADKLHVKKLPRPIAAAANLALAWKDTRPSNGSGLNYRLEEALCTTEYSQLAERVGSSLGPCAMRSADYLNWRYQHHPHVKYEFLTARRADELVAYCVFTVSEGQATVAELFGPANDDEVLSGLLGNLGRLLRARSVASINLPLLCGDPRSKLLGQLGFWEREAAPVVWLGRAAEGSGSQMLLMHGDRES